MVKYKGSAYYAEAPIGAEGQDTRRQEPHHGAKTCEPIPDSIQRDLGDVSVNACQRNQRSNVLFICSHEPTSHSSREYVDDRFTHLFDLEKTTRCIWGRRKSGLGLLKRAKPLNLPLFSMDIMKSEW